MRRIHAFIPIALTLALTTFAAASTPSVAITINPLTITYSGAGDTLSYQPCRHPSDATGNPLVDFINHFAKGAIVGKDGDLYYPKLGLIFALSSTRDTFGAYYWFGVSTGSITSLPGSLDTPLTINPYAGTLPSFLSTSSTPRALTNALIDAGAQVQKQTDTDATRITGTFTQGDTIIMALYRPGETTPAEIHFLCRY